MICSEKAAVIPILFMFLLRNRLHSQMTRIVSGGGTMQFSFVKSFFLLKTMSLSFCTMIKLHETSVNHIFISIVPCTFTKLKYKS